MAFTHHPKTFLKSLQTFPSSKLSQNKCSWAEWRKIHGTLEDEKTSPWFFDENSVWARVWMLLFSEENLWQQKDAWRDEKRAVWVKKKWREKGGSVAFLPDLFSSKQKQKKNPCAMSFLLLCLWLFSEAPRTELTLFGLKTNRIHPYKQQPTGRDFRRNHKNTIWVYFSILLSVADGKLKKRSEQELKEWIIPSKMVDHFHCCCLYGISHDNSFSFTCISCEWNVNEWMNECAR